MAKSSSKKAGRPSGKRIKLLALAVVVVCLLSSLLPPVQSCWRQLYDLAGLGGSETEAFTITFLDVGAADAAVIQSPDCSVLLMAELTILAKRSIAAFPIWESTT